MSASNKPITICYAISDALGGKNIINPDELDLYTRRAFAAHRDGNEAEYQKQLDLIRKLFDNVSPEEKLGAANRIVARLPLGVTVKQV